MTKDEGPLIYVLNPVVFPPRIYAYPTRIEPNISLSGSERRPSVFTQIRRHLTRLTLTCDDKATN